MRLLTVCWLLGFSAFAADDVPVVCRTDFYAVTGTNATALLDSMRAHRPFRYNAYTEWHIDWNYEFLIKGGEASLRSFDAKVQVRYTLPQWMDSAHADQGLKDEWKRFMNANMVHERGHAALGLAAAKEMIRFVKAKDWSAENRNELKARIDEECEKILKGFRAQETAYDEKTEHGRTQGARLAVPGNGRVKHDA